MYVNNQSTIKIANNVESAKRSRHFNIKYHYLREQVTAGNLTIEYVKTTQQLADVITKPLPKGPFY